MRVKEETGSWRVGRRRGNGKNRKEREETNRETGPRGGRDLARDIRKREKGRGRRNKETGDKMV